MPRPPGVMGSTVSSRTNAKAAREVCQGTWAWDRPMPRRHASRTSHKVRLLAAVVAVIRQPRAAIKSPARSRKPSSDPGMSKDAGRRATRQAIASAGCSARPAPTANDSLRMRRPSPAAKAASKARPTAAAAIRPARAG